jgi:hypothetical protein
MGPRVNYQSSTQVFKKILKQNPFAYSPFIRKKRPFVHPIMARYRVFGIPYNSPEIGPKPLKSSENQTLLIESAYIASNSLFASPFTTITF